MLRAPVFLLFPAMMAMLSGCGDDGGSPPTGDDGGSPPTADGAPSPTGACAGFGGDVDGDEVCQIRDNCPDVANAAQRDEDGDGIGNLCDATPARCDDFGGDADGDSVCGTSDNCPDDVNGGQQDRDADGIGDACDPTPTGAPADSCADRGGDPDGDAICQASDNCPEVANADQRDTDRDGWGDACDETPGVCDDFGGDSDGDSVCDEADNCVDVYNRNQLDLDFDGIGDVCDPTPPSSDPAACRGEGGDLDLDGWCGTDDNCPSDANADQADTDRDGLGDVCDPELCNGDDDDGDGVIDETFPDDDGDGVANCIDRCDGPSGMDSDGDGLTDCEDPCPMDWANDPDEDDVCTSDDNCPSIINANQRDTDDDGIGDVCDVEECDGVNNDGDWRVDEGFPDADGDEICDGIDACPADPSNDVDEDGICGDADNCPTVANGSQADADGDGTGDACDLDAVCDPAATALAPGTVALSDTLELRDVVGDPTRDVVYVGSASATEYVNEVVAIDTASRSVLWSLSVGGPPHEMAIAPDGSRLYVALGGSSIVRVVDIPGRRACGSFPLTSASHRVSDMSVLPGDSGSVLVAVDLGSRYGRDYQGWVFDEGVPRMRSSYNRDVRFVEIADDSRAFASVIPFSSSSDPSLYEVELQPDGIDLSRPASGFFQTHSEDFSYADERLFGYGGRVADASTLAVVGTLPENGPVIGAPAIERAFVARPSELVVVDLATFLIVRREAYADEFVGTPQTIDRFGTNGLAIKAGLDASGLLLLSDAVMP